MGNPYIKLAAAGAAAVLAAEAVATTDWAKDETAKYAASESKEGRTTKPGEVPIKVTLAKFAAAAGAVAVVALFAGTITPPRKT